MSRAVRDRFYGEPIELKGKHIYFTSWKYVRPGTFHWKMERKPGMSEAEKLSAATLQGDSDTPAVYEAFDMPRGIRLVAQKAEKVALKPGQFAAQVYDNGLYKTWYTLNPPPESDPSPHKDKVLPGHNPFVCYAESDDGLTWRQPKLGLYEYQGNKDNNIVYRGEDDQKARGFQGGSVFVDPSSKDERYKMFSLGFITDDEWDAFSRKYPGELDTMARRKDVAGFRYHAAVFGAVSPDGIHWKSLPEPLMIQHSDTVNTCYYDLDLKKYVAYVRTWQLDQRSPSQGDAITDSWMGVGRRSIGRSFSDDFRHFTKPEIVISTGADMPPNHVWYLNCKTTLPDAPDNHVMFPWLWETENDGGDVYLLSSPDGATWSQVPGGPVVERGPIGGSGGGYVTCSGNLLEYPDGKWGLPYSGNPIPHKYPGRDLAQRKGLFPGVPTVDGLATWPKGRLVALQADEEGEFATVAMMPPGRRIRLNAIVNPSGYIKVAVHLWGTKDDVAGRSFDDCDRLLGNALEMPVTWKGDADLDHGGKPFMLRFKMKQAKLFGVEFL